MGCSCPFTSLIPVHVSRAHHGCVCVCFLSHWICIQSSRDACLCVSQLLSVMKCVCVCVCVCLGVSANILGGFKHSQSFITVRVFVFISLNSTCTVSLMSLVCVCEFLSNISDDSDVKEKRVCCI